MDRRLDTTDPERLEAALEALPTGAAVRVVTDGEEHVVHRVPGGWYLPGDVAVASADVAEGRPTLVEVVDPGGDDPDLDALAEEEARGRLSPAEAVARARAALAAGDSEEAEAAAAEMDDLDSVGVPGAGAARDEILAWLGEGR